MKKHCIGIDIGGTHTDGVLIDSEEAIVASCKVTTTENPADGVSDLIEKICRPLHNDFSSISAVHIGTTHPTNSILEARGLARVGIIRIAPDELIVTPGASWPRYILSAIAPRYVTLRGGYECTGRAIQVVSRLAVQEAIKTLLDAGVEAIAIVGVFSPLVADQEKYVRDLVHAFAPHVPVTCSSDIGGIGFIDRENGAILNASLAYAVNQTLGKISQHIADSGIHAPIRISQNDGTLMDCVTALRFPVRMISAGPTNSAVGAAHLAGLDHCVVADIGGTSTDVVVVRGGIPRKSYKNSSIGGISLNARMPDVISIALGGGSIVAAGRIGPSSVSRALRQKSEAFGGTSCTLTDCAIKTGALMIDGADPACVKMSFVHAEEYLVKAVRSLERALVALRGAHPIPAVLVGGGASLFPADLFKEHVVIPSHAGVANAVGAAFGKISATIDTVVSLADADSLSVARATVYEKAEQAGANPKTISIVDEVVIPYAYTEGNMARVVVMATGESLWK